MYDKDRKQSEHYKTDFVFDPCSGSATTLIACENLNRNYFGYEKDEDIYKRAKNRLNEHIKNK